ncbi:MAG: TetR/AcrR family transcriptional regulator [Pseudomonadota bacterium]
MNERQKHIIAAAIPLFLNEGVSVSTAHIAKVAGVSNGTLFNAFQTKQELIDAIYRSTKLAMLAAFPVSKEQKLDRRQMRTAWDGYLEWARAKPNDHRVMHLLREAGLASPAVQAEIDALYAPHAQSLMAALEDGSIRGPSVAFIGAVIFAQIDLVIDHNLTGADEDLAFEMLCNAIGLTQ